MFVSHSVGETIVWVPVIRSGRSKDVEIIVLRLDHPSNPPPCQARE